MHVETEIKCLLNKKDFRKLYYYLHRICPKPAVTRQVNYYFDARDLSHSSKDLNIRIRLVNRKAELTLKVPINKATRENVISSYEYNMDLNKEDASFYIATGLSTLDFRGFFGEILGVSDLNLYDLKCYGHLRTTRIAFTLREDLPPLLMDISRYLCIFDYEIEWELTDINRAQRILDDIFIDLGIKNHVDTKPKRQRFFDRLKKDKQA